MKRILCTLSLVCFVFATQAQERMIVHMKDGKTVTYEMQNVAYVELEGPNATSPQKPTADPTLVGGTVGDAVDLGLSVMWASHNLGAEHSGDIGLPVSWDDTAMNIATWGEEWRMPTDEEWRELYEKCDWSWIIRDGIGGRLITGPSGNSIFLPATGFQLGDESQMKGCIGLYWMGATPANEPQDAMATFFDSANIYKLGFPKTNKYSIRAVRK